MAVYDLEEQEQIDALKAWWSQYGRLVIAAAVAFVLGVAGVQGWLYYKSQSAQRASDVFADLEEAARIGDPKRATELTKKLMDEYARTAYAARAALLAAKVSADAGDAKGAGEQLRWAADNARDEQTRALANLRLAAVLLDAKQYDEAMKALGAAHPEPFAALFADARGDVYVAQGKPADARLAYQAALDKLPKSSTYRNVVELKRDALGAAK
jgi:predicted negative regulator of RcsB-dependent stress response